MGFVLTFYETYSGLIEDNVPFCGTAAEQRVMKNDFVILLHVVFSTLNTTISVCIYLSGALFFAD